MFHKTKLVFDKTVRNQDEKNNIDKVRAAIVNVCLKSREFTEIEKRYINFRPTPTANGKFPLPTVIFGQVIKGSNYVEIFAFNLAILEKIAKVVKSINLNDKGELKVEKYQVMQDIPFLPKPAMQTLKYKTVTPFIFYDKAAVNFFYSVEKKYDKAKFKEEIKQDLVRAIKLSIKGQLSERLNKSIEQLDFVNNINIKINDFTHFWGIYHPDQPCTPKIMAEFESDWELPIFLGHQTGKGFGQIKKVFEK